MTLNKLLSLSLVILLSSCNADWIYIRTYELEDHTWHVDNSLRFDLSATETKSSEPHLYLALENDNQYPFNNLYLFVSKYYGSKTILDTLQYQMTKANGTWLGKGFGRIKTNILILELNATLPDSITVTHGMRPTLLPGISQVGLIIEQNPNI